MHTGTHDPSLLHEETMNNTPEITAKPNGRLYEAFEMAGNAAVAALDLELLKKKVQFAVDDTVLETRRILKHGTYAVEDVIEDTGHLIRKNPWQSVGYALGAGVIVGMVAGWLITRSQDLGNDKMAMSRIEAI